MRLSLFTRLQRTASIALAVAIATPAVSFAARDDAPAKEFSDKVSEILGKLDEFLKAEDWDTVLEMVNQGLQVAKPDSYDVVVLNQIKTQIFLQSERYTESIAPLEEALRVGMAYELMDERRIVEFHQILSQLYFQEAMDIKGTSPADQSLKADYLSKAYQAIKVYIERNPNPTEDSLSYAATMIYTQATMDEENPDNELLGEAQRLAERGLLLKLKPKESFYVLILAALQQDGKNEEAAELLEILVKQNPTSKQYWQQLQATYLNLANNAPEGSVEWLEYNIRTIYTLDRAQKLGILDAPRDHFNRVGILMNIQQFEEAITHLEAGIASGKIEDTLQNWEYLASCYQQVHKELSAINALQNAANKYPDKGEVDFRIANIYYLMDKMDQAYDSGVKALEKGNLKNRNQVLMFVAYMGYELKKYEEVLPIIQEAVDAGADRAQGLFDAINTSIEERKAALEATI